MRTDNALPRWPICPNLGNKIAMDRLMKSGDRRDTIMEMLLSDGTVSLDDFAARFGVSKMTIHRDLDELEANGFLRKVRGGASVLSSARFESDYRYRQKVASEEKARIARQAAHYVEPGQTIIVDDGSTSGKIAAHLAELQPLTVITNNLGVINELAGAHGINLIALGGQYSKKFNGFFGLVTDEALKSLRADVAFITSSAIHGTSAFHQEQEVVATKRAMLASSEKSFLLVDHDKFDKRAVHFFTELNRFTGVITGAELGEDIERGIKDAGGRLIVAG